MRTHSRTDAARHLADEIDNGASLPHSSHRETRLVMPARLSATSTTTCVVCGAGLVGRQKTFCFGHWDYLVVPNESASDPERFVAYLGETFDRLRVEHIQRHWMAVIRGHSRCEICDAVTSNVERLVTGDDRILKQHTVCPDHQTAR